MASNLREETVNGYSVAVCENSKGETCYLYEGEVTMKDGKRRIFIWKGKEPGLQGRDLYPITMPQGYELVEASENNQPLLKKR
jgi:hypothetical protein